MMNALKGFEARQPSLRAKLAKLTPRMDKDEEEKAGDMITYKVRRSFDYKFRANTNDIA